MWFALALANRNMPMRVLSKKQKNEMDAETQKKQQKQKKNNTAEKTWPT